MLGDNGDQLDLLVNGVKVTFFYAQWDFLKPEHPAPLNIARLESIVAMKVNLLFLRAKYRDYYELYWLAKEVLSLAEIYQHALPVVHGLTYKLFCIALSYIDDIEDDNITPLDPMENLTNSRYGRFSWEGCCCDSVCRALYYYT